MGKKIVRELSLAVTFAGEFLQSVAGDVRIALPSSPRASDRGEVCAVREVVWRAYHNTRVLERTMEGLARVLADWEVDSARARDWETMGELEHLRSRIDRLGATRLACRRWLV
jgi:hypothetical protein